MMAQNKTEARDRREAVAWKERKIGVTSRGRPEKADWQRDRQERWVREAVKRGRQVKHATEAIIRGREQVSCLCSRSIRQSYPNSKNRPKT
jgi:hypothetical protein